MNGLLWILTEFCTPESRPTMTAGPKYEYTWADGVQICGVSDGLDWRPAWWWIHISSKTWYVAFVVDLWSSLSFLWTPDFRCNRACYLIWILFPLCQGTPFPPNFKEVVKTIFKRLFRVYAHIYHSHFQKIVSLKEEDHLNTCFKHFILFTNEFGLIDKKSWIHSRS